MTPKHVHVCMYTDVRRTTPSEGPRHPNLLLCGFGVSVLFKSIDVFDVLEIFSTPKINLPGEGLAPRELLGPKASQLLSPEPHAP